jgi:ABC-type sugar transport system substrate-binding protein
MRIVVSLPESANEFQVLQAQEARTMASRLQVDVEILDAENNGVVQIQQIFQVLRTEPKPLGLAVEPVGLTGLDSLVQKAAAAGVGVAVLNCTFDSLAKLRGRFPQTALFTVASDQGEIGQLQGQQARALLPGGGTVLYIHGPQSSVPARERYLGFQQVVPGSGIRTVVLDGQWTEDSAEQVVRSWLRLKTARVDLVAAQDDAMARGALRAIKASPDATAGWPRLPVLGIDGVPTVGQRLVDTGELTGTIVMPSNTGAALEHLTRWLKGGAMPAQEVRLPVSAYPDIPEMVSRWASSR